MTRWMLLLALTGVAQATEPKTGYVLKGPTEANQYILFYDNRHLSCVARHGCEGLTERVPFYAAFEFSRVKELVEYVGYDHVYRDCMLHECKEY
jgi:hypothetical protein